MFRPFLGTRSSRLGRLKHVCLFGCAACGLRRLAALTGLERIAYFTLATALRSGVRPTRYRLEQSWP
eukprot:7873078-Alexandrium_andersonii.AAC.1